MIVTMPDVTKTSSRYRKFMKSKNLVNKITLKSLRFRLSFQIRMHGRVRTSWQTLLIGVSILADDRVFIPAQ